MRNAMVTAVVVVLAMGVSAQAGVLATDSNGLAGYQGSILYDGLYTDAMLDYCVYEPGMFGASFGDPMGDYDDMYVYAYQVYDVVGGAIPSWNYVNQFSVGLNGDEDLDIIGYVMDGLTGEVPPSSTYQSGDLLTAVWAFAPAIYPNEHSPILYFSSPYAPEWDQGTVSGAFPLAEINVPSPAPEPVTLALLAMGGVALLKKRR